MRKKTHKLQRITNTIRTTFGKHELDGTEPQEVITKLGSNILKKLVYLYENKLIVTDFLFKASTLLYNNCKDELARRAELLKK